MFVNMPLYNKIVWLAFFIYLFSVIAFSGQVELFVVSNVLALVYLASMLLYVIKKSKLIIPLASLAFLPFAYFCYCSVFWSSVPDETIIKSNTVFILCVMFTVMTCYLHKTKEIKQYIYSIPLVGLLVLLYTLSTYGLYEIQQMILSGKRIGGMITNENILGIFWAICSTILYHRWLYEKKYCYLMMIVPLAVTVALTGSKKGIIDLILGVLLLHIFHDESKNKLKKYLGLFVKFCLILVVIYMLGDISLFEPVKHRFDTMLNLVLSDSKSADASTLERLEFIERGLGQFLETPLLGIGISASGTLVGTYLHNNYIELLATGGIVGFSLFYFPVGYIFVRNINILKKDKLNLLINIIIIITVINQFAAVNYYSKEFYLFYAIFLANALNISSDEKF